MKCSKCHREVKGSICSYCGEVLPVEEVEAILESKKKVLLYVFSFAVASFILGILANFFQVTIVLSLTLGIISLVLGIKYIKTKERKGFIYSIVISCLGISLALIVGLGVITQEVDRLTAHSKYSSLLELELPDRKADTYDVDFGYQRKYKVVSYGYDISFEEYDALEKEITWLEENNFFIGLVTDDFEEGLCAIYDRSHDKWQVPTDTIRYSFVMVRIMRSSTSYKLELYDVTKRNY